MKMDEDGRFNWFEFEPQHGSTSAALLQELCLPARLEEVSDRKRRLGWFFFDYFWQTLGQIGQSALLFSCTLSVFIH